MALVVAVLLIEGRVGLWLMGGVWSGWWYEVMPHMQGGGDKGT